MAEEALATFQSLLDSVPGWISELETILTTATVQQSVLAAEHAASTAQAQSSQITFDFLRLAQRKRKTASVCSKADSRRSDRARRQCLATIYYDSSTQKRFETLVRGVGSSRNGIRKAKLSMKVDSFALIGSDISDSSDGEETIKGLGTFTYRRRTSYRQGASDTQSFDNVDAALEKAQMSCEKAAHSILREGDCSADITQARQNFESALDIVRTELPRLTKRADKAVQRRLDEKAYGSEEESQVTQHSGVFSLPSDGMLEVDSDEQVESDGEDFNVFSMKLPPSLSKFGSMRQPQARLGTV